MRRLALFALFALFATVAGCASTPAGAPAPRSWLYFPEARVYAPAPPSFYTRTSRGWQRRDHPFEPLDGDAPIALEDQNGEPWNAPRPVPGRAARVVRHEWVVYRKANAYYCRLHGHYLQQTEGVWVEVRGPEEALASERPRALLGYAGPVPWDYAPP